MHLWFDLDGTLTDSFPGISRSINHALAELGRDPVADARLRGLVGTSLTAIFAALLKSSDAALLDRAVAAYRDRFNTSGIFENSVFPGMAEALVEFRAAGHSMRVVTVKPAVSARRVLAHFALDALFDAVHGPEIKDRTCNKADLVAAALTAAGGRTSEAVMIGDRAEDVTAARANAIRAVGVGWGYGSRAELADATPDYIAETVSDLKAWVNQYS